MKSIAMALAAASMTVTGTLALTAAPAEAHKRDKARRYYTSDNGVRYWQDEDPSQDHESNVRIHPSCVMWMSKVVWRRIATYWATILARCATHVHAVMVMTCD